MTNLGIEAIAHALPSRAVSSHEIADRHGFDEAFIREKLGIANRFMLAEGENLSSLASDAVLALLQATSRSPEQIGALVVVTQTPDHNIPHVSAIVQAKTKLPTSTLVLDIGLGCSGFVLGLRVLECLMTSQGLDQGILVTADAYSRIVDPEDRATSPLFGDAAAATLVSASPLYSIGSTTYGADGHLHEALALRDSRDESDRRGMLFMDGRAVFEFAMRQVPADVRDCLELNGLSIADIDLFVFHQANRFMLISLAERLGIPLDRLAMSMNDIGNTTSSSIPIALEREVLNYPQRLPKRVLLCGFGVGLSWATTVLTRVEENTSVT